MFFFYHLQSVRTFSPPPHPPARALAAEDRRVRLLMTMTGAGYFTAMLVVSEVGDVGRFHSDKEFASWMGLVPSVHQSGERTRIGGVSGPGNKRLNWAMLECARAAVRFDARFRILARANIYIKNRVLSRGEIELVTEQFNTDAKALMQRIEANEKYGSYDINEWIFSQLELRQGLLTLELGPGNGKQTLPLAQLTQNNVLAIDVSSEALEILMEAARKQNLNNFIIPLIGNFDELDKILSSQSLIEKKLVKDFDRVISCFSICYSKNPSKLFHAVSEVMSPKGILFFCGPSRENNIELIRFHNKVRGKVLEDKPTFMESEGIEQAQKYFKVEVSKFENPLRFTKPKDLYNYWSSYYLYDEAIKNKFKSEIKQYFLKHPIFETVKRVIGIKAWKR